MIECPKCRSTNVIPIVYGFPSEELFERADRGEVKLGGCVIEDDNPNYFCKDCEAEFKAKMKYAGREMEVIYVDEPSPFKEDKDK